MKAYRICERKNGNLMTLFHPLNGTRILPLNIWLTAELKPVRDGDKRRAKEYISGFHVLEHKEEIHKIMRLFKKQRDLVIVECEVEGIRKKDHSRFDIILADQMKLIEVVEKLNI